MAAAAVAKPSSMSRAKSWNTEVEDAWRFQLAGYRDEKEYKASRPGDVERWPNTGFVKKLQRKDGNFYYFNRNRECPDKDVYKCKLYYY